MIEMNKEMEKLMISTYDMLTTITGWDVSIDSLRKDDYYYILEHALMAATSNELFHIAMVANKEQIETILLVLHVALIDNVNICRAQKKSNTFSYDVVTFQGNLIRELLSYFKTVLKMKSKISRKRTTKCEMELVTDKEVLDDGPSDQI